MADGAFVSWRTDMRAIPRNLMPHEVMYHKHVKSGGFYDEGTLDKGIRVRYVRLEPSSRVIRDKNNAEIQLAAVLLYDCRNSSPKNIIFKTDDVVIFNGDSYRVQTAEPLYDHKKLHHYELGLVKYG